MKHLLRKGQVVSKRFILSETSTWTKAYHFLTLWSILFTRQHFYITESLETSELNFENQLNIACYNRNKHDHQATWKQNTRFSQSDNFSTTVLAHNFGIQISWARRWTTFNKNAATRFLQNCFMETEAALRNSVPKAKWNEPEKAEVVATLNA